jgi:signal transduction histidine kinase
MSIYQSEASKIDILVIDDTPDNLRLLSTGLSEQGYNVRGVISGAMGLMGAKAAPPDLILLDINMPEMNGYEVCQALKADEQTSEIPVIFISALDEVWDKVRAFAVGGRDYISKPFHFEEVVARIENQLTIRNLQKQLQEQNVRLQQSEAREREKSQQLEQALNQLQNSQAQLVQSAKMSSLGQLVAGIAHEINNPVNFIHGNVNYAREYVGDLLKLLELYQKQFPDLPPDIQHHIEVTDLEFVKGDLPKLLVSMQVGTERICGIVHSLRNFSRLDEAQMKTIDLHEGIDSTLMLLEHRLESRSGLPTIQIVKEYADLPEIQCYPGQLNQVFMNILSNAIDALEESKVESLNLEDNVQPANLEPVIPCIQIRTEALDSDWATIRIADNGPGMSEEIQSKLFDPFFTTKSVGKGTGLGLSISYQIIKERHGGSLQCFSELGQGTEFVIKIPFRQP